MKRFRQHNFTLVEMLVVVAIIAILVGITIGGYKIARKKIDESRTKAALGKLKLAVESFKNKHGYYPQGTSYVVSISGVPDINNSPVAFSAFIIPANNTDKLAKILNLTELKENHGDTYSGNLVLVDSYPCKVGGKVMKGRPIYYVTPGVTNTTSYDLYSAGPDGELGTKDDIWAE